MDILPQLLINALIAGSIYALVSSGLSLTYGLLRILNFGHGHIMMAGVYVFYLWYVDLNMGLPLASLLTVAVMTVLAMVSFRIFVAPFTRYSFILTFVTTLALSIILESAVSMLFGVNVKSLTSGFIIDSYEIAGIFITPIQVLIIASALIMLLILGLVIHFTSLGRRIQALSQSESASQSIGINSTRMSYGVFIVSTLLATYSGILVGFETNIQPTMGHSYTIKAFASMVLGGLGNIWGTVAGSYLLGLIENLSIGLDFGGYSLPAGYKDAFAFLVILLVLLVRPHGLFRRRSRAL